MRLLVVDDSRAMRSYVKGVLKEGFDCSVVEAQSGFEALRILPREDLDMVIADINMPDINGLELIRFIRTSPKHATVPVLVISTQASDKDRERVANLGGNRFLAKPFEPEQLLAVVRELVAQTTIEQDSHGD